MANVFFCLTEGFIDTHIKETENITDQFAYRPIKLLMIIKNTDLFMN
jgi:hypothetical protein